MRDKKEVFQKIAAIAGVMVKWAEEENLDKTERCARHIEDLLWLLGKEFR